MANTVRYCIELYSIGRLHCVRFIGVFWPRAARACKRRLWRARVCRSRRRYGILHTYFNGLFEQHWHLYTCAGSLTLTLRIRGRAALRIWRRTPDSGQTLLHEQEIADRAEIALPRDTPHFRQAGLLWFDLTAFDGPIILQDADWSTSGEGSGAGQPPARLGVVICTFNREAALGAVLTAIVGDEGLLTSVARITVVNQGRPGLVAQPSISAAAARLGPKLRVVEQANLGGAGGFGRGLVEALDDQAVTHVCFLDDDVRVRPESLRRMAASFTLAQDDVALGGHMLDSVRPTTLYEAGAVVLPNWAPKPLHYGLDLSRPKTLDALLDPYAMHYNGWWMFGFPKRWIDRVGRPPALLHTRRRHRVWPPPARGRAAHRGHARHRGLARAVLPQDRRLAALMSCACTILRAPFSGSACCPWRRSADLRGSWLALS